ncbi:MAG: DEAD/DEAH box helicase, partial [Myxococcales bacterium]|nr:DEAD/DEAH box helicase [Myxococcales bacterium]
PLLDLEIVVPVMDMTQPSLGAHASASDGDGGEGHGDSGASGGGASGGGELIDDDGAPGPGLALIAPSAARRSGGPIAQSLAVDTGAERRISVWPAIYPSLLELVYEHQSTIIFVNARGLCERLCQRLNELAGEELMRAHHGSVSHQQRKDMEEALKAGQIRGIVATSSLELGIDMGAVDLVLLVESPGAVSRGLQRIGRAGHQVGAASKGRIFPKHRGDLLEAAVVAKRMGAGAIESLSLPRNPLDVLAQQIVAICSMDTRTLAEVDALVHRCASYRDLSRAALVSVLDMLSGRYPSTEFADLRPLINWDRERDLLSGRRAAKTISLVSGGTIPDRGLYGVYVGEDGPRVGELDEEMVYESRAGEVFTLGASTWRIEKVTRDRVLVSPAPGELGKLPFWRGDGPGRPLELGKAVGAFVRELARKEPRAAETWLREEYRLDGWAARNLVDYICEQREATGALPTDRAITIERFRDELGDFRVCLLSPFGARVHAPWALALETLLSVRAGFEVQTLWSDDGISLRFAEIDEPPGRDVLVPDPDELEDLVMQQLSHSALFAGQFRENAARSLLMPRRRPGARSPLWAQRLKAQSLMAVAMRYPAFPVVLETYRSCLQDVFDLEALREILRGVAQRAIRVDEVETVSPSPFSRSLVFAYVAQYMYEGDAPMAERRAQALALDRELLRDLLGQEELRALLDAQVIAETEDELQGRREGYRARHADALSDLLRRVGDLSLGEIAERTTEAPEPWLDELERKRRVLRLRVGGEERYVAVEDAALYRDGLGTPLPVGVPAELLEPRPRPIEQLFERYARTHGPFVAAALAERFGLTPAQADTVLRSLERRLVCGALHPHGDGQSSEWCDAEVLRRLRRRTLARLRGEVAPVEADVLGRFLPAWHGVQTARAASQAGAALTVASRDHGAPTLSEAIEQLEGVALSFAELERNVLPARVAAFAPRMLDELGALGEIVWIGRGQIGRGALSGNDGRVALYRRERAALLCDDPPALEDTLADVTPVHRRIAAHLDQRGASFFSELVAAARADAAEGERPPDLDEIEHALWDLVWAGIVTNDTFQALRALGSKRRSSSSSSGRPSRRGGNLPPSAAGRWSLTATLLAPRPSDTERAHARALMLLERYGIASREAAIAEALPGGFAAIYPVLRAMEEAGKARRGYFAAGLSGAQFAFPGAVDRLRAARTPPDERQTLVLAATDPANPFGALLPWPARESEGPQQGAAPARRVPGASVVLVDGTPVLYLDRGGRRALTFPAADDTDTLVAAASALRQVAARSKGRYLRVETIDGEPARSSSFGRAFERADFSADYKGLVLEARR